MTQLLTIAALWILAALVLCTLFVLVKRQDKKMEATATEECWEKGILAFRASTLKRSRHRHLNRETGELMNCFLPRCAKNEPPKSRKRKATADRIGNPIAALNKIVDAMAARAIGRAIGRRERDA